jgi:hypothetical protein
MRTIRRRSTADDDHGRPVAALRPGLREDLAPLPPEPAGVRRRLRPRLVQADAPRHGPACALPRPAGAEGSADLAGPGARGRPPADRRAGHRRAEGQDAGLGPVGRATGQRPPGPRPRPSAAATSAAAPTARASAWRRRRTGKPTSRPNWPRCWRAGRRSRRTSTRRSRRQEGLAGRPDRARRLRSRRSGGEEGARR